MKTYAFQYRGQHLFECKAKSEAVAWTMLKKKFSEPKLGWASVTVVVS